MAQAIGISRRLLNGTLEASQRRGMFFCGEAREVREAAKNRFVWGQLAGIAAAKRFAHGVRQHAIRVGNGRDDAGDEVILQRENVFLPERCDRNVSAHRWAPERASTSCTAMRSAAPAWRRLPSIR